MSTYIYLQCLSHDPIIRAEQESGQRLRDLPQLREDILNRKRVVEAYENYIDATDDTFGIDFTNRYRRNTACFLWEHQHCALGIIDEYQRSHPTHIHSFKVRPSDGAFYCFSCSSCGYYRSYFKHLFWPKSIV